MKTTILGAHVVAAHFIIIFGFALSAHAATYINTITVDGDIAAGPVPTLPEAQVDLLSFKATVGTAFVLDGTKSIDDSVIKTYSWTQVSGPTVKLSGNSVVKPTFTPSTVGVYVFQLVTVDSRGVKATKQFTVDAQGPIIDRVAPPPPSPQEASTDYLLKIDGVDGETAIGSANGGVWKTTDGGAQEEAKGNVEYEWKVEEGESAAPKANDRLQNAGPVEGWGAASGENAAGGYQGGVVVASGDINGLTDDEKRAHLLLVQAHAQVRSGQDLENFAKGVLLSDGHIKGIKIAENVIEVESHEDVKLFWAIPMRMKVVVVADASAEGVDRVKVILPWWHVLTKKNVDDSAIQAEIFAGFDQLKMDTAINTQAQKLSQISNVLKTRHDTVKNSIGNIR